MAPTYPLASVKTTCNLRTDLRHLDKTRFEARVGKDGRLYFGVKYKLILSTAAANLRFSLEIDGKEMGSVEATYV